MEIVSKLADFITKLQSTLADGKGAINLWRDSDGNRVIGAVTRDNWMLVSVKTNSLEMKEIMQSLLNLADAFLEAAEKQEKPSGKTIDFSMDDFNLEMP